MKKKFSTMKLQNRFLLILLLALTISATLFELLWLNKWTLVNWTGNFEILQSRLMTKISGRNWTKLHKIYHFQNPQTMKLPQKQ